MIADDAEGDVHFLLLGGGDDLPGGVRLRERAVVLVAAHFLQFVEDRAEDVGLVVGDFSVGEVSEALRALDDRGEALEAHAGIDVLRGQRGEGAVGVGVELDEDVVPDLDALGAALVDEPPFGVARGGEVDVDLRARTARAGLAHHPEIVLFVAVHDVDRGIEPDAAELLRPQLPRLLIALARIARIGLVDGGVNAVRREMEALDDQLPRPPDGFLFEVVAEAPVPEHLEEGVVIRVEPDVIEVVVFAAGADALLGVGGAGVGAGDGAAPGAHVGAALAEEDGHELVHAGVGEQQIRRVGHERRRRHDGVLFLAEEIEELLADLGAGEHGCWGVKKGGEKRGRISRACAGSAAARSRR